MACPSPSIGPADVEDALALEVGGIIATCLAIPVDRVSDHLTLSGDLGVESLELIDIVIAVEIEFDIEIDDSTRGHFETVGDITDHVRSRKKAQL